MICVYCGTDFEPHVIGAEYKPRAKCPHCGKTNGLKIWDVQGDGRKFAPYRMGRGGERKVTMTFRLPRNVAEFLRTQNNQSEYLEWLLTREMK